MSSNHADLDLMIQSACLLDPNLSARERRARITSLATVAEVSDDTIYRRLKRIKDGLPTRKARADAGQVRCLPADVQDAARALFLQKQLTTVSTAWIAGQLRHQFEGVVIADAALRRLRQATLAEQDRWSKIYARIERSLPNEEWMIDSTRADYFFLVPGRQKPVRSELTVCQDAYSRSIMYARYAPATPYTEVAGVLHQSIRKQSDQWPMSGIPQMLTVDWGKVYMSKNLEAALGNLGITRNDTHPYTPTDKGKVERVIGTLHRDFEPSLPGFCGANNKGDNRVRVDNDFRQVGPNAWVDKRSAQPILTLAEANELLWQWIVGTYHQHTNRMTGMSPLQSWLSNPPQAHTFREEFLEQSFLSRTRKPPTVRAGKLHCLGCDFWAPELVGCNGLKVEVRFNPGDVREVYVYGVRKVMVGNESRVLPWGRICTAKLDAPLLAGTPQAEAELAARRQANRQAAAEQRAWESYYKSNPAAARDLTEKLAAAAAAAPAALLPDPTERPDPVLQGVSHEAEVKHETYTIRGLPMIRRAANQ